MRRALLVVLMILLGSATVAASQPATFGVGFPAPPYHRWDVTVSVPLTEHLQLFAEGPGIRMTEYALNQYDERYGVGAKVFPLQRVLFVGGGWWTPDAYRFDEDNRRYDIRTGPTWLAGIRIFAEAGATLEVRRDGFGGWGASLGISF